MVATFFGVGWASLICCKPRWEGSPWLGCVLWYGALHHYLGHVHCDNTKAVGPEHVQRFRKFVLRGVKWFYSLHMHWSHSAVFGLLLHSESFWHLAEEVEVVTRKKKLGYYQPGLLYFLVSLGKWVLWHFFFFDMFWADVQALGALPGRCCNMLNMLFTYPIPVLQLVLWLPGQLFHVRTMPPCSHHPKSIA